MTLPMRECSECDGRGETRTRKGHEWNAEPCSACDGSGEAPCDDDLRPALIASIAIEKARRA